MTSQSEFPVHSFSSAKEFETFLKENHSTLPGLHLKFAKKSSGIPSISGAEAVEVALCYGWIDGQAKGVDERWWTVRYTPRRAKSIWSQKNVNTVARLIEESRMQPAGLACVEAAKADGRWERAYAGPATITVPDDFAAALAADHIAAKFFAGLNKTERYAVLWRVETASPNNRANRIQALVDGLTKHQVPGREETAKVKRGKVDRTNTKLKGRKSQTPDAAKKQVIRTSKRSHESRREGLRSQST